LKYSLYQNNWSHQDGTDAVSLIKKECTGSILSLFSGKTKYGDLRIDLDPSTHPDIIADVYANCPIKPLSFDTVVLDPPFSYYNKQKWIIRLSEIARKKFILCVPQIMLRIGCFDLKDIINVVTNTYYIRMWLVFERHTLPLTH